MKAKTVCDEQLADEIKKLLEQSDVDDTVITEVIAKINDGDKMVDADGQEVDSVDLDTEEEVEDEDDIVEENDDEEIDEDDDFDLDEETDDEEAEDEDIDLSEEGSEEVDEEVDEEVEDDDLGEESNDLPDEEDLDDKEVEDGEEVDEEADERVDEVEDEGNDPMDKLKDPVFADGFNRGYAFAIGLMKMGKLPEASAADEAEEEDEEKPVPSTVTPAEEEKEAEKKVIAQDSIQEIKATLAKEMAQQFSAKLQAKDKVKSLVGEVRDIMAFDSASDIYKFALEQNGVNVKKYKPTAYEGMVDMMIEKRNNVDIPVVIKDANPFEGCSDTLNQAIARLKKINSK